MDVIIVDHGERQKLMKILNVSYPTIKKALNGEILNERAQKIREMAIKRGGKILTPNEDIELKK